MMQNADSSRNPVPRINHSAKLKRIYIIEESKIQNISKQRVSPNLIPGKRDSANLLPRFKSHHGGKG